MSTMEMRQGTSLQSLISERFRAHSNFPAEKSAEVALVAEAEAVGDLLYWKGCAEQQRFRLADEIVSDALTCAPASDLFHHVCDILGRKAHLIGVPFDGMMFAAMYFNQGEETPSQLFRTGERVKFGERFVVQTVNKIGHRAHKVERHLTGVAHIGCQHNLVQQLKIVHGDLHLLFRQRKNGRIYARI